LGVYGPRKDTLESLGSKEGGGEKGKRKDNRKKRVLELRGPPYVIE